MDGAYSMLFTLVSYILTTSTLWLKNLENLQLRFPDFVAAWVQKQCRFTNLPDSLEICKVNVRWKPFSFSLQLLLLANKLTEIGNLLISVFHCPSPASRVSRSSNRGGGIQIRPSTLRITAANSHSPDSWILRGHWSDIIWASSFQHSSSSGFSGLVLIVLEVISRGQAQKLFLEPF